MTLLASAFPLIDNLQWGLGRQATAGTGRLAFARDGSGRMLIFPFSSTQGGNATLINVVNADQGRGKAVKVRYRGASNADAIFDFQLSDEDMGKLDGLDSDTRIGPHPDRINF